MFLPTEFVRGIAPDVAMYRHAPFYFRMTQKIQQAFDPPKG